MGVLGEVLIGDSAVGEPRPPRLEEAQRLEDIELSEVSREPFLGIPK